MRILAISGSLRAQSSNKTLLQTLALVAPGDFEVELFQDLAQIPAFNPDVEFTVDSTALAKFKQSLRLADAVVFSTPEYAHGMPGALKNALDWVVGSGELSDKPVALVNASSRGVFAQAALREVIKTMNANLVAEAEVTINLVGKTLTAAGIAENPEFAGQLRTTLTILRAAIQGYNESLARHPQ